MKRWYLVFLTCCVCINLHAQVFDSMQVYFGKYSISGQEPCCMDQEPTREQNSLDCIDSNNKGRLYASFFIPTENDSIMYVRLNLIFIQKDDGTGNFAEDSAEHQLILDDVITILNNNIISSLSTAHPGTACFSGTASELIEDMRIRFVDHRYYIKKSSKWDNHLVNSQTNLCPASSTWYLSSLDDSLNSTIPDSLKGINIYFTEDATLYHRCWEIQDPTDTTSFGNNNTNGACSMFPTYDNLQLSSRLHMPCQFSKYWWMKNILPQLHSEGNPQWIPTGRLMLAGSIASALAHELGHSFNLRHPIEDTHHYFYPETSCMATIMQPSKYSPRNFLPPIEIGRMYFHAMTTNLQQFIPSNTYIGQKTINTTTSLPRMRMYYSLIVGSSGDLTMPCDITFSTQGSITVQNGGRLSIEGASLQSVQGSWGGIIVQSGGQLILSDVNIEDYNIVVNSGGSVIVKNNLTIEGDHYIKVEEGGYLCVDANASINLADNLSYIMLSPNAILGCPSCLENCITNSAALTHSGNGHIATYEYTNYLQDTVISNDHIIIGNPVYVGYDVTTVKPYGEVVVMPGGNLRIRSNTTILTKDFEVKLGGSLKIDK